MKRVQFPGGSTAQEDQVIGLARQVRVDETGLDLRLHDGSTPGGIRIPNENRIKQLIATGSEGAVGTTRILADTAELAALTPDANTIGIVRGAGEEEIYVWRSGAGDEGTIPSSIDGYWQRLDSAGGLIVRFWRAGLINLEVDGVEPASNQDITVWLTSGVVKMWDGTAYIDATPATFARLLASVGGYYTGSASLPDRLAEVAVTSTEASIDDVTESGWWLVTSGTTLDMPVAGLHLLQVFRNANNGYQILHVRGTPGDKYVRTLSSDVWSGWSYVAGQLPSRLASTPATATDANAITESGWTRTTAATANLTSADEGSLLTIVYDSNFATQIYMRADGADGVSYRRKDAGVWQPWVGLYGTHTVVPIADGGTGATSAADARSNLGLGTLATLNSPLPIANGGTAATTAASARSNLGLGALATQSTVNLGTQVTGQLAVADGGTGANDVAEMRSEFSIYSKAEVDALVANHDEYYTGSSSGLTSYPLGTNLLAYATSDSLTFNQSLTVRQGNGSQFNLTSGTTLSGTWRYRGMGETDANTILVQRVA